MIRRRTENRFEPLLRFDLSLLAEELDLVHDAGGNILEGGRDEVVVVSGISMGLSEI